MKHSGSLSGSFPISNGVKQRCFVAPTFFSVFFSIMLCEAKEDLPDGIYIHFQTAVCSAFHVFWHARKL